MLCLRETGAVLLSCLNTGERYVKDQSKNGVARLVAASLIPFFPRVADGVFLVSEHFLATCSLFFVPLVYMLCLHVCLHAYSALSV